MFRFLRKHATPIAVSLALVGTVGVGAVVTNIESPAVVSPALAAPSAPTGNDDFDACHDEGREFCPELFERGYVADASSSWKLDLVACLNEHEDELSDECAASLDRRADLNALVNEACRVDRGTYCRGVRPSPGSEAGNDCLREHINEVSPECRAALQAHEAAQPTPRQP